MQKLTDAKAATILAWALAPLAIFNLFILTVSFRSPEWNLQMALFDGIYMIPALIIWVLLLILATGGRSLRFTQWTWGSHVVFNMLAALFWMGLAIAEPGSLPWPIAPLIIVLPVLTWTTYFFQRTFTFILTNNLNP